MAACSDTSLAEQPVYKEWQGQQFGLHSSGSVSNPPPPGVLVAHINLLCLKSRLSRIHARAFPLIWNLRHPNAAVQDYPGLQNLDDPTTLVWHGDPPTLIVFNYILLSAGHCCCCVQRRWSSNSIGHCTGLCHWIRNSHCPGHWPGFRFSELLLVFCTLTLAMQSVPTHLVLLLDCTGLLTIPFAVSKCFDMQYYSTSCCCGFKPR